MQWSPDQDEAGWLASYILVPEAERTPHVSIGTSTDRLDSHSDARMYFITFAKSFPESRVAPYMSLSFSAEEGWRVPFGANLALGGGFSLMPVYDGRKTHLLATYSGAGRWLTGIWISLEKPGLSLGVRF